MSTSSRPAAGTSPDEGGTGAEPDAPEGAPIGRRVVLGLVGLGVLGIATGAYVQRGLDTVVGAVAERDPTGLTSLVPGGGGFRYYSVAGSVPAVGTADYALDVTGLVQRSLRLTWFDLQALPQVGLTRDFQCVTGWRVEDVPWTGVRLRDVLDRAGVAGGATAVRLTSFDGIYTESLTMDQARRDDVLVATGMLGGPVSHAHGGPVRLFVAPMYGYKSLKWLGGVEVTDTVQPGYWEGYGYDVDGWVGRSNGRDDEPTS